MRRRKSVEGESNRGGDSDVFDACPDEEETTLADYAHLSRHVAWASELLSGRKKPTKVPYNPGTGRKAKADDPDTWGTRKQAERRAKRLLANGAEGGIGIELGELPDGRHLCGMDLDTCLDPETFRLKDWAQAIVDRLKTRTEVSPSLTGVKAFFLMSAADVARFRAATGNEHTKKFDRGAGEHPPGSEAVVSNKYFTMTGDLLPGYPETLREVPFADLAWWIETEGPKAPSGHPRRDDSRSARAMRLVGKFKCRGRSKSDWIETLDADPELSEWAEVERNVDRAWERFDCSDYDVERLNELHAFVMVRGKAFIATKREDGGTDFGPERDLHALYANDRVTVTDKKTEAVSQRWMRDPIRRNYREGIEFAPGRETPGKFNLWRGWAVEPDTIASCELFLKHVREVICGGNEAHFDYIVGWLAHMVQRPHEKPGVGLVLRGLKGTGKDSVGEYIAAMIGRHHAPTVSQSEHIVGRFNFRLESALMLHVQEGSWAATARPKKCSNIWSRHRLSRSNGRASTRSICRACCAYLSLPKHLG